MNVCFIYGAHNVVTPRRFLNTSTGMLCLDHGANCGMSEELAKEISKKLNVSPKTPHQIISTKKDELVGDVSSHYDSAKAIEIIKNIYAPAFVNQFCANEIRQEILEAKTEQLDWIKRELTRVKVAS